MTTTYNNSVNNQCPSSSASVACNSNTTFTLTLTTATYYVLTFTSSCTLAFTFPTNQVNSIIIEMINAGGYTITWPAAMVWPGGTIPTFTTSGTDVIVAWQDAAGTVFGSLIGLAFAT